MQSECPIGDDQKENLSDMVSNFEDPELAIALWEIY
jgi:hypothetical protein